MPAGNGHRRKLVALICRRAVSRRSDCAMPVRRVLRQSQMSAGVDADGSMACLVEPDESERDYVLVVFTSAQTTWTSVPRCTHSGAVA